MLKKFYVDNYKSLINVNFEPGEMNLLLGLNNAGKTNLCQALRFVSGLAFMNLNDCAETVAGGRHGMTNVYFEKSTIDFAVSAELPFGGERLTFHYELKLDSVEQPTADRLLSVGAETLRVTGPGFDGVSLIESTPEGGPCLARNGAPWRPYQVH